MRQEKYVSGLETDNSGGKWLLILLHSKRTKLYTVLAFLSKIGLNPCLQIEYHLNIGTGKSGQIVETLIRLLLKEQSDQGLHYLPFHLHL